MKSKTFYKKTIIILAVYMLAVTSTAAGCGQSGRQPAPQQQSGQQQQQQEKVPQKLRDIEKSIEEIFKQLEGPAVQTGGDKSEEQQQGGEQDKGSQQKQQGQQQQGQGQQQQGQQQGQQKPAKPADPWQAVSSTVDKLHFQWNEYMPEAVKKGASLKITDNFSNSLNYLTTTLAAREKNRTMLAANGLYGCIPDLYSLYRTKMSPEIKRMHYLIRNIILTSAGGDWAQAGRDMNSLKASWSVGKGSLGKEQEKDLGKLDMAVTELEKVVAANNQKLTDIKGKVALSDIQSVEKSFEKEDGEDGGSSDSGDSSGGGGGG